MKKQKILFLLIILFSLTTPLVSKEASLPELKDLSLEEKVGQLLIVHFLGEELNEQAKKLINDIHVGGIIYYQWANGLHNPFQIKKLSHELQSASPIPLLIAIDQEGGAVSRLQKGFTHFPGNASLVKSLKQDYTEQAAFATGEELKAVGINLNFAPTVDVCNSAGNTAIGIRSYSDSPEDVSKYGSLALAGFEKAGIISCLKHFPGYGQVHLDPHTGLSTVNKTIAEWEASDLVPYKSLLDKSPAVMTAHVELAAVDPDVCATLSNKVVEGILRQKLKYNGVIITDSLTMGGVLKACPNIEEAAVKAIQAGHDMIVLGGKELLNKNKQELTYEETAKIHKRLVEAVSKGEISLNRLDESVRRILALKQQHGVGIHNEQMEKELAKKVGGEEHQNLAKEIAQHAVKRVGEPLPESLRGKKIILLAPEQSRELLSKTTLFKLSDKTCSYFYKELNPNAEEIKKARKMASWGDIVVLCTYNAWNNPKQVDLFKSVLQKEKPVIVFIMRDPQDADLMVGASVKLITYSPDPYSIEAAIQKISFQK